MIPVKWKFSQGQEFYSKFHHQKSQSLQYNYIHYTNYNMKSIYSKSWPSLTKTLIIIDAYDFQLQRCRTTEHRTGAHAQHQYLKLNPAMLYRPQAYCFRFLILSCSRCWAMKTFTLLPGYRVPQITSDCEWYTKKSCTMAENQFQNIHSKVFHNTSLMFWDIPAQSKAIFYVFQDR